MNESIVPLIVRNINYLNSVYFIVAYSPKKTNNDPPIRGYAAADLHIQPLNDIIYGDPEYTRDEYIYPAGHTQS